MATSKVLRESKEDMQQAQIESARLRTALAKPPLLAKPRYLRRIPVRDRHSLVLVPTSRVTMIVAQGDKLILRALGGETYTFSYRLKDLATQLDPAEFVQLGRGALANLNAVARIVAEPGGTNRVIFNDGQALPMSRIQSRRLRQVLFELLSHHGR